MIPGHWGRTCVHIIHSPDHVSLDFSQQVRGRRSVDLMKRQALSHQTDELGAVSSTVPLDFADVSLVGFRKIEMFSAIWLYQVLWIYATPNCFLKLCQY